MINGTTTTLRRLALLVLACHATTADASIFRWTDTQGQTHYGDRPPRNREPDNMVLEQANEQQAALQGLRPEERDRLRKFDSSRRLEQTRSQHVRSLTASKRAKRQARCSDERRRMKDASGRDSFKQHARYLRSHCW